MNEHPIVDNKVLEKKYTEFKYALWGYGLTDTHALTAGTFGCALIMTSLAVFAEGFSSPYVALFTFVTIFAAGGCSLLIHPPLRLDSSSSYNKPQDDLKTEDELNDEYDHLLLKDDPIMQSLHVMHQKKQSKNSDLAFRIKEKEAEKKSKYRSILIDIAKNLKGIDTQIKDNKLDIKTYNTLLASIKANIGDANANQNKFSKAIFSRNDISPDAIVQIETKITSLQSSQKILLSEVEQAQSMDELKHIKQKINQLNTDLKRLKEEFDNIKINCPSLEKTLNELYGNYKNAIAHQNKKSSNKKTEPGISSGNREASRTTEPKKRGETPIKKILRSDLEKEKTPSRDLTNLKDKGKGPIEQPPQPLIAIGESDSSNDSFVFHRFSENPSTGHPPIAHVGQTTAQPPTIGKSTFFQPAKSNTSPEKAKKTSMESYLQLSAQLATLKNQDLETPIGQDIYKFSLTYFFMRTFNALLEMHKAGDDNFLITKLKRLRNCIVKCALNPQIDINLLTAFSLDIQNDFEPIFLKYRDSNNINPKELSDFCTKMEKTEFYRSLENAWKDYHSGKNQPIQAACLQTLENFSSCLKKNNSILKVFAGNEHELFNHPDRMAAAKALMIEISQVFHDVIKKTPAFFACLTKDEIQQLNDSFSALRKDRNNMAHNAEDFHDIDTKEIMRFYRQAENKITPIIKKLKDEFTNLSSRSESENMDITLTLTPSASAPGRTKNS